MVKRKKTKTPQVKFLDNGLEIKYTELVNSYNTLYNDYNSVILTYNDLIQNNKKMEYYNTNLNYNYNKLDENYNKLKDKYCLSYNNYTILQKENRLLNYIEDEYISSLKYHEQNNKFLSRENENLKSKNENLKSKNIYYKEQLDMVYILNEHRARDYLNKDNLNKELEKTKSDLNKMNMKNTILDSKIDKYIDIIKHLEKKLFLQESEFEIIDSLK